MKFLLADLTAFSRITLQTLTQRKAELIRVEQRNNE
jgi:hypothetical protein